MSVSPEQLLITSSDPMRFSLICNTLYKRYGEEPEKISPTPLATPIDYLKRSKLQFNEREFLLEVVGDAVNTAESLELHQSMAYYSIAGSALIEASVGYTSSIPPDGIDRLDELAGDVSLANQYFTLAAEGWELNTLSFDNPTELLRTRMHLLFIQVYEDMVYKHVSGKTQYETTQAINTLLKQVKALRNDVNVSDSAKPDLVGLEGELIVLKEKWESIKDHGTIAVPSTINGGNGWFNYDATHDIVCFKNIQDGWEIVKTIEVKTSSNQKVLKGMAKAAVKRYTMSEVIIVNPNTGATHVANKE